MLPDKAYRFAPTLSAEFLRSLRHLAQPFSFELVCAYGTAHFQLSCPPNCVDEVRRMLSISHPGFGVEVNSFAESVAAGSAADGIVGSFEPSLSFMESCPMSPCEPLQSSASGVDPYAHLLSFLESRVKGLFAFQVCFSPLPDSFVKRVITEAAMHADEDFIENGPARWESTESYFRTMLDDLRWPQIRSQNRGGDMQFVEKNLLRKLPAWRSFVRLVVSDPTLLEDAKGAFLRCFETPYQRFASSWPMKSPELLRRTQWWSILGTDELASFVHVPTTETLPNWVVGASGGGNCPTFMIKEHGMRIGTVEYRGRRSAVALPDDIRERHLYLVGKSRSGKSTVELNLICQDVANGEGVGVIDPHGDLAEDALARIPASRVEDSIYFDAGDKECPIPINVMQARTDEEVRIVAEDLVVSFRRMSETWGERMESLLRFTMHTLLRVKDTTLLDVYRMLSNAGYRERILSQVKVPVLLEFWREQFPKFPRDAAQPILSRMSELVLSPTLSAILGQTQGALDFSDVVENQMVFIANLGKLGEDEKKFLGSLLVSQIQLAIMRRAAQRRDARKPFYLYVDEFQNFTTSAFEKILSEAGKFRLSLTMAHQFTSQLDDNLRKAIIGNVGTTIVFSLGKDDAAYFRSELGGFTPEEVTNLDVRAHEALCRPLRSGDTFKFTTLPPCPVPEPSNAEAIVERTRRIYGRPMPQDFPGSNQADSVGSLQAGPASTAGQLVAAGTKTFETNREKILHYLSLAEYLSTPQLLALGYRHLEATARAAAASRDLRKLLDEGLVHRLPTRIDRCQIYAVSASAKPTAHNLAVRDLFVKIMTSDCVIDRVAFAPRLGGLTPDLAVTFTGSDGRATQTLWEYDAGTEGMSEILSKLRRYEAQRNGHRIIFVVHSPERAAQFLTAFTGSDIIVAERDAFGTLGDAAFRLEAQAEAKPFLAFLAPNNQ